MDIDLNDYQDIEIQGDYIAVNIVTTIPTEKRRASGIYTLAMSDEPKQFIVVLKVGTGVQVAVSPGDLIETDGSYFANQKKLEDGSTRAIIKADTIVAVYKKK